jgi:hypothetical protein
MSTEASKRALANATARDLESFKRWLGTYLLFIQSESISLFSYAHLQPDIDPVAAKTPFFAPENAAKWAVPEQWHVYWTDMRREQRRALSQSGATNTKVKVEHNNKFVVSLT